MNAILSKAIGAPDYRKDRVAWNKEWERRIKSAQWIDVTRQTWKVMDTELEQQLCDHRLRIRHLCHFQRGLAIEAVECFVRYDFEKKWLGSDAAFRQRHILEGIVRVCKRQFGMEEMRLICDEITLPYLQKDGGKGYLNLLRHFMAEDTTTEASTPIYIANARWDRVAGKGRNQTTKEQTWQAIFEAMRTDFICE